MGAPAAPFVDVVRVDAVDDRTILSGATSPDALVAAADATALDAPVAAADVIAADAPPACVLRIVAGPTLVQSEVGGDLRAPHITLRSPSIDAVATFVTATDLRPSQVFARSVSLRGGEFTLGTHAALADATTPAYFAANGSQIGGCITDGAPDEVASSTFARWFSYAPVTRTPVPLAEGSTCVGAAHTTDPWLFALRRTDAGRARFDLQMTNADGAPVGPPRPAFTATASANSLVLAQSGGGFVWASSVDASGAFELGSIDESGLERHALVRGFRGSSAVGLGSSRDGSTVLVAGRDRQRVVVAGVARDGTERFRSPPLDGVWDDPPPSAIVDSSFGIVVATLTYGDDDPHSGSLDLRLLRRDGSPAEGRLNVLTHRELRGPTGVAAAVLGDLVLLHWTGSNARTRDAESFMMAVGCR